MIGTFLLAAFALIAGCAGTTPVHPGQTLASAGFRLRTPETPKQKQIYASLPDRQVHRLTIQGQTYYLYKDASKGLVLVGREAEYQRYRQMAHQEVMEENNTTALLDDAAAQSWSSAYALQNDWR